jgi:hypothetical protein
MTRTDALRMIWRRARAAGIETELGCHSFRATGITIYLQNGGLLEHAHAAPRWRKAPLRSGTCYRPACVLSWRKVVTLTKA